MTLADLTRMHVVATDLDELYVAQVQAGQPARITLDALPGRELNGEVAFVSYLPVSDPALQTEGNTFEVNITLNDADPALHWGMTAVVEISASG